MYDVKLKVVRNGNTYTTTSSLTINKSDDGKAWTGFASRGAIGGDNYVNRADGQISGKENKDGRSLKERLEGIGAIEIIPILNCLALTAPNIVKSDVTNAEPLIIVSP